MKTAQVQNIMIRLTSVEMFLMVALACMFLANSGSIYGAVIPPWVILGTGGLCAVTSLGLLVLQIVFRNIAEVQEHE